MEQPPLQTAAETLLSAVPGPFRVCTLPMHSLTWRSIICNMQPSSSAVSGSVRSFRYDASQESMDRRKLGGVDATDTLPIYCSALLSYLFSGLGDQPLPRHDLSG